MTSDRATELYKLFVTAIINEEGVQNAFVEKIWASASEEERQAFSNYVLKTMRGHVNTHVDREISAKKWYISTRVREVVEALMGNIDSSVKEAAEAYVAKNLDTQIITVVHEAVGRHLATLQRRILGR